jgi:hypothetical protein
VVSPQGGTPRGWAAPPHGEAGPWPSSSSLSVFGPLSGKIRLLELVSSNFENISCVAFLKHINTKIVENRELALWHLVSRLVP